jgi:glucosylceramidase
MYDVMAKYYSLFLQHYRDDFGVRFWAVSSQNEPTSKGQADAIPRTIVRDGACVLTRVCVCVPAMYKWKWQSMYFNASTQTKFIGENLGPLLRKEHPDVKIMMLDDQRTNLPAWADKVSTPFCYESGGL